MVDRCEIDVEALEQLASALSHDVRTPVRHMAHFLDFFLGELSEPLSPAAEEHLSYLRHAMDQTNAMLETLIDFARLERSAGDWDSLGLDSLITDALARTKLSLAHDDISLSVHGNQNIRGSKALLLSLFSHLFENSVMFGPEAEPVQINIEITQADTDIALLVIEDNGPGILGSAASAFRMFQKGKTSHSHQGEGVGLSFARRIALLHGGELALEAEPGKLGGVSFRLTLPLAN